MCLDKEYIVHFVFSPLFIIDTLVEYPLYEVEWFSQFEVEFVFDSPASSQCST
jgi:hypothetical protein